MWMNGKWSQARAAPRVPTRVTMTVIDEGRGYGAVGYSDKLNREGTEGTEKRSEKKSEREKKKHF